MTDQTQPQVGPEEPASKRKWPWVLLWALLLLALTAYLVLYVFLYGGIVQVVDGFAADPNNGSDIALGILRVAFAAIGAVPAFFGFIGLFAWAAGKPRPRRGFRAKRG